MTSSAQGNTVAPLVRPAGQAFHFRVLSLRPRCFWCDGGCGPSHERRNLLASGSSHAEDSRSGLDGGGTCEHIAVMVTKASRMRRLTTN